MTLTGQKTQSLITSLNTGNYIGAIKALTSDLGKSVAESTPIQQLINSGAKEPHLVATLAMLVTKYASMLTVGGNLKAGHEVEIAKMLIESYPTASLDDFKIMLSRGVRGRYGEIFRFDVAVIFSWMAEFQAEWAEENERRLAKESGKQKTAIEEIQDSPEADKILNGFLAELKEGIKPVRPLTREEIKAEGKERAPIKKALNSSQFLTTAEQAAEKEKRLQWMRECFDPLTGKPREGWVRFEEWKSAKLG